MATEPEADGTAAAEFDIVIAGSGAAGMTAALTAAHLGATAVVLEKAGSFGGSTARPVLTCCWKPARSFRASDAFPASTAKAR